MRDVLTRLAIGTAICLAAVLLLAPASSAQDAVSVRELRMSFDSTYKNELVAVHGWVSTEKRVLSKTFKGYYIKDRFGDFLLIRTTQQLPDINSELDVKGVAVRDADTGDVYLTETTRDVLRAIPPGGGNVGSPAAPPVSTSQAPAPQAPGAAPAAPVAAPEEPAGPPADEGMSQQTKLLIGFGVAIVVLVSAALFLLTRKREAPAAAAGPGWDASASAGAPTVREAGAPAVYPTASGPTVDDYKTVKVYKTTKVLPGKLVVVENKQETDVIHLTDQSGRGEVEIGRDSPDITSGIRIKDRTNTLSRRQARIAYSASSRQFSVVNLAGDASNPTIVNGRQMTENESLALKDGDVLVMGNVEMKFRQK